MDHLGSIWPATDQDMTKAGHVERLGGLEPEMIQDDTKTDHLDVQEAPCTFMRPKKTIYIWILIQQDKSKLLKFGIRRKYNYIRL